jgi:putative membrane protein insertion efficiency factor
MATPADRRTATAGKPERPEASVAATPFLWMLSFYQKTVGPVVSGRCPMYPTCSQYSVDAIRKHGPAIGIILTADRIIHELDEQNDAPLVKIGSRYRYADPVGNNDFWWYHE